MTGGDGEASGGEDRGLGGCVIDKLNVVCSAVQWVRENALLGPVIYVHIASRKRMQGGRDSGATERTDKCLVCMGERPRGYR